VSLACVFAAARDEPGLVTGLGLACVAGRDHDVPSAYLNALIAARAQAEGFVELTHPNPRNNSVKGVCVISEIPPPVPVPCAAPPEVVAAARTEPACYSVESVASIIEATRCSDKAACSSAETTSSIVVAAGPRDAKGKGRAVEDDDVTDVVDRVTAMVASGTPESIDALAASFGRLVLRLRWTAAAKRVVAGSAASGSAAPAGLE